MSDRQLMRAVRAACEELVAELDALGWEFEHAEPLHPPGVVTLDHLGALEAQVGELPEIAVDFWLEVGGIDLSGEHPDWDEEEDLRPFVIEAPVDELLEHVARGEPSAALPVSPDFSLTLPDGDVRLPDGQTVRFVDHLREALLARAGIDGFAGDRPAELDAVAAELPRF